jgi:hypothetical protein
VTVIVLGQEDAILAVNAQTVTNFTIFTLMSITLIFVLLVMMIVGIAKDPMLMTAQIVKRVGS